LIQRITRIQNNADIIL